MNHETIRQTEITEH